MSNLNSVRAIDCLSWHIWLSRKAKKKDFVEAVTGTQKFGADVEEVRLLWARQGRTIYGSIAENA